MATDYLFEIIATYERCVKPLREYRDPLGCTEDQCTQLALRLGFPLPEAYRQYLLWAGVDVQGIFRGSDCFIGDIPSNQTWLPGFLNNEHKLNYALPTRYLCFYSHQGYDWAWFELADGIDDNPFVHRCAEQDSLLGPLIQGRFTDWIAGAMRDLARCT